MESVDSLHYNFYQQPLQFAKALLCSWSTNGQNVIVITGYNGTCIYSSQPVNYFIAKEFESFQI